MSASRTPRSDGHARRGVAVDAESGLRRFVNVASHGALTRMSRLPRLTIPAVTLALLLVGLAAPLAYAVPALGLIGLFLLWLAYLSWPVLSASGRLTRVLVVAVVAACVVARVYGWI